MGYIPSLKFKFGNTYGDQTNRIFLDPGVNMSPRTVLNDICPEDCSGVSSSKEKYHFIFQLEFTRQVGI